MILKPQFLFLSFLTCFSLAGEPLVQSVSVPGTGLQVKLTTQVGQPYNSRTVEQDVRYLWSLGRFEDIRVEAAGAPDHDVSIIFHTIPRRYFTIHEVSIEPNSFGLKVVLPQGTRIDRERAHHIAVEARKEVQERGFTNAQVTYELTPARHDEVDLKLKIDAGAAVRVGQVEFAGDTAIPTAELQRALRALHPKRILPGWRLLPSYTQSALDADVSRLRSYYFFKGYFDANLQATDVDTTGTSTRVRIEVQAGPQYGPAPPGFCSALFAERRAAESEGILDFTAIASVDSPSHLTSRTELGQPYRVGRIEFSGNRRYSDAFVRRNVVLDEGQPLDEQRLHQSVARLNRTNAFENIDERSVAILRNPKTRVADIHIRLTERKRGAWSISGPVGPMSFAERCN